MASAAAHVDQGVLSSLSHDLLELESPFASALSPSSSSSSSSSSASSSPGNIRATLLQRQAVVTHKNRARRIAAAASIIDEDDTGDDEDGSHPTPSTPDAASSLQQWLSYRIYQHIALSPLHDRVACLHTSLTRQWLPMASHLLARVSCDPLTPLTPEPELEQRFVELVPARERKDAPVLEASSFDTLVKEITELEPALNEQMAALEAAPRDQLPPPSYIRFLQSTLTSMQRTLESLKQVFGWMSSVRDPLFKVAKRVLQPSGMGSGALEACIKAASALGALFILLYPPASHAPSTLLCELHTSRGRTGTKKEPSFGLGPDIDDAFMVKTESIEHLRELIAKQDRKFHGFPACKDRGLMMISAVQKSNASVMMPVLTIFQAAAALANLYTQWQLTPTAMKSTHSSLFEYYLSFVATFARTIMLILAPVHGEDVEDVDEELVKAAEVESQAVAAAVERKVSVVAEESVEVAIDEPSDLGEADGESEEEVDEDKWAAERPPRLVSSAVMPAPPAPPAQLISSIPVPSLAPSFPPAPPPSAPVSHVASIAVLAPSAAPAPSPSPAPPPAPMAVRSVAPAGLPSPSVKVTARKPTSAPRIKRNVHDREVKPKPVTRQRRKDEAIELRPLSDDAQVGSAMVLNAAQIEMLTSRAEVLSEEQSRQFRKTAGTLKTKKGFLSRIGDAVKERKKKKKKKPKIDNILADLENTFNGLSAMLASVTFCDKHFSFYYYNSRIGRWCHNIFYHVILLILAYVLVACFTFAILLPAVFLLLVLRTQTIERKVETGFIVRQEVLAQETVQQKSLRFIALVLRGLPMAMILVGWPILAIYYIIPKYQDSNDHIADITIGIYLVFLVVLQLLGTVRSGRSFLEKMKANQEDRIAEWKAQQEKKQKEKQNEAEPKQDETKSKKMGTSFPETAKTHASIDVPFAPSDKQDSSSSSASDLTPLPISFYSSTIARASTFRWSNVPNLIALVSLIIEALQLVLFSVQTLDQQTMQAPSDDLTSDTVSAASDAAQGGGGDFGPAMLPILYVNLASYLTNNVHYVYAYGGVAIVVALLLLFLMQFLFELVAYAAAKRSSDPSKAAPIFFHSFVGSIVYGHGEVKGVPGLISNMVAVLADTFFLVVAQKLISVITCIDGVDEAGNHVTRMLINPNVICWEGEHQFLAAISLVAFGYYLPLCAMISPMLVEAEDAPPPPPSAASTADGKKSSRVKTPPPKKDIIFVQPFLSCLVVSKCLLLVGATFFGRNDPTVTVAVSLVTWLLLFIICLIWLARSHSALLRPARFWWHRDFLHDPYMHVAPPALPDGINIVRVLAFVGGVFGSIIALIALKYPDGLGGDKKYIALAVVSAVLVAIGLLWRGRATIPAKVIPIVTDDEKEDTPAGVDDKTNVDEGSVGSSLAASTIVLTDPAESSSLPSPSKPPRDGGRLLGGLHKHTPSDHDGAIEMQPLPVPTSNLTRPAPSVMFASSNISPVSPHAPSSSSSSLSSSSTSASSSSAKSEPASPSSLRVRVNAITGVQLVNGMWSALHQ